MEGEIQRDLGKHDAQIDALNARVDVLHQDMKTMMSQLALIQSTLSEARGGWRTLMFVSGLSATVGGVIVKLAAWLQMWPR